MSGVDRLAELDPVASLKTKRAKRLVWVLAAGIVAAMVVLALIALEVNNQERITAIEDFDPCVSLSQAVSHGHSERVPRLTRECQTFLDGLAPLVTIKLSCAIIEKARYVCPAPRKPAQRDGSVLGPSLPSSLPAEATFDGGSGRSPNDTSTHDTSHGDGQGNDQPGKRDTKKKPPPTPAEPAPALPAPELSPGNSGDTPSAENGKGVQACVHLVVSKCVKLEANTEIRPIDGAD